MGAFLVTGAAGFIGSHVSTQLLSEGHEVVGLDNLNDAYDVRLKEYRLGRLSRKHGFRFARVDIRDSDVVSQPDALARALHVSNLGQIEAVVHLAARAGIRPSLRSPGEYVSTNVQGTLNLLELCRTSKIPSFVCASSSSVYGDANPPPFREDGETGRPLSPYAATKKAAEVLAHSYHHLYGLNVVHLRYFTVYGPAGRPDMAPFRFVRWIEEGAPVRISGNGTQSRDFTYVDDIVAGTVAATRVKGFEVMNLGSDRPHSLLELVAFIEGATGKKARIQFANRHEADTMATWADVSRAAKVLAWKPRTSLATGVERILDWYRSERGLASSIELGE